MISLSVWSILWSVMGVLAVWTIFRAIRGFRSDDLSLVSKVAVPLPKYNATALTDTVTTEEKLYRKPEPQLIKPEGHGPPEHIAGDSKKNVRDALENLLSLSAILGDFAMIVAGFILSNLLCRTNLVPALLKNVPMPSISKCSNMILAGSAIVLWGLSGKQLYAFKNLLNPSRIWHKFVEALGFCLLAFIGISVVVRTDPPIPWIFFVCAAFLIFMDICIWRVVLSKFVRDPGICSRLRRRVVVIGGGVQTQQIQKALGDNSDMEFVGWVQAIKPNHIRELDEYRLGSLHELGHILHKNAVNIAVLTESESLQREGVLFVANACENDHVQFKMVPHFFEILVSGLRPETIGGIDLLGVECLPLNGYRNRVIKRTVDIVGAIVGLALSVPVIAILGAVVYWESPGPILYRQLRQGRNGRLFYIIKIRSMKVNAEAHGKAQWAQRHDHRRLRIGAFMRKWNLDELPQFWNVLSGEMSLVGARPERPELIARFKSKIPHYQARHLYRPGMTGWAQVNGWRGNTDLEERIRHDIWYLENWSVWLDFRIMLQTFFSRENAY